MGQDSTPFELKGQLLDAETKEPVPLATILLVNKESGTSGTSAGKFRLPVEEGDHIRISSIGYESMEFIVTSDFIESREDLILYMIPAVYELDSVVVIHLTDDFYLKRKKSEPIEIIGLPKPTDKPRDWSKPQAVAENGGLSIYGLLNVFDRKLQEQKKLRKLEAAHNAAEERKKKLEAIYNKDIVKRVTGIDDRVIDEFMDFCNFTEGELLASTEYDVTKRLLDRYHAFLRR